jgi:BirA family biotin operon repressor/biotin-[acetyl-CoA-carboxylase] ligase
MAPSVPPSDPAGPPSDPGQPAGAWADLDRPPLSAKGLASRLVSDGFEVTVVAQTGSTNADVAQAARQGAAEGYVLVAEEQTGGRGRLTRTWLSPPRAGLTFSVLLRPPAISGWIPLLTGVAVTTALQLQTGLDASVKWPNDVLVDGRKVAGVLTEAVGPDGRDSAGRDAVVVGVGLNVTTRQDELPGPQATSLALAGARTTDRGTVLAAVLRSLASAYAGWLADPATLLPAYRSVSSTLGREVALQLPDGTTVTGVAEDLDPDGRLIVAGVAYGAGDVVHLRPT